MVIDKKIRERKSLGSFRLDFKWQSEKGKCVLQKGCRYRSGLLFSFVSEESWAFSFWVFEIHIRFEHTCDWLIAF